MSRSVGERLEALARFFVSERARSGGLTYVQTAQRDVGSLQGHFNTLGFILISYDLDEIFDYDLDV